MDFKERIEMQETLYGVLVTMTPSSVSELLSQCGFDWLWIDMEHAPLSLGEVQQMAQAKDSKCAALVRIPINSEEWIKRVLDLGVEGIIIPHVNTAEETQKAVAVFYYPPKGKRSVGLTRASFYGMNRSYKEEANAKRLLFIQIEDKEGVKNIQEIAQVPGLDGIMIGPYDLSGSYGKLGQIQDPEITQAIDLVVRTCKEHGKAVGIFAKDATDARRYVQQGFQLVAVGIDISYLWNAAKAMLDSTKNAPEVAVLSTV